MNTLEDRVPTALTLLRHRSISPLTVTRHNDIVVLTMIPDFDERGNLPPGRHRATWQELEQRYGANAHRRRLLGGMKRMLLSLKSVGCRTVYMNGSFVSAKDAPSDYDGCWDRRGVDLQLLRATDPVLLDFTNSRAAQKLKYAGEMFPADIMEQVTGRLFVDFFTKDKNSGDPKGIIELDLGGLA